MSFLEDLGSRASLKLSVKESLGVGARDSAANLYSISNTPCDPMSLPGVILECTARREPLALLGVVQNIKE